MKGSASVNRIEHLRSRPIQDVLDEKSRSTCDQTELEFIVVNESIGLCNYRQAAFWHDGRGVCRLSGVVEVEANAPYVQWLNRVCRFLAEKYSHVVCLEQQDLPESLAAEWISWLPRHIFWVPLSKPKISRLKGSCGLIFASESAFLQQDKNLLVQWCDKWYYTWTASGQVSKSTWLKRVFLNTNDAKVSWWRRPYPYLVLGVLLVLQLPVNLTLLAPAELIPKDPVIVRSPMDGVIDELLVAPNSHVEVGAPLFSLDKVKLQSQFNIAQGKIGGLRTQYNQVAQLSLTDPVQKAKLAAIAAEIDQKEAELEYLSGQLQRSEVSAVVKGTVLYPAADELKGKPVQTGEGVMRLVNPENSQVEAWLDAGDAIPIPEGAETVLYLSSMPTRPVPARVFLMGYEPTLQPSGNYAYRVRAEIQDDLLHRVGLKGIAKIVAGEVPLYYLIFRRPLSSLRQFFGI
ncbi:MAG: HlyD family efflux transporter periplasmic adaptor subunit [Candidatus Thiodiazotropha sp.]